MNWVTQIGHLRPWEYEDVKLEIATYDAVRLEESVTAVADWLDRKIPPPWTPSDVELIMHMAVDLANVYRDIPGARQLFLKVPKQDLNWRILLAGLGGASYVEMLNLYELEH